MQVHTVLQSYLFADFFIQKTKVAASQTRNVNSFRLDNELASLGLSFLGAAHLTFPGI